MWDSLALVLLLATCIVVPYQVAFVHTVSFSGSVVVYLLDLFFLIDLFLNFRTSCRHQGSDISDKGRIARHYLRSFFLSIWSQREDGDSFGGRSDIVRHLGRWRPLR